ncbi:farnesyl pyrophosphate synthase 1-like [Trichoplusia ni]|uniref:Farnesyl pyrophosphate synthase n=1 Tax=Trichoplusia ni TaxID=7111 RepID=A0A7E5WQD4_TRINI|nr:farnesyl pyrophosphate synthase 1-like [Trichoplusia ni]
MATLVLRNKLFLSNFKHVHKGFAMMSTEMAEFNKKDRKALLNVLPEVIQYVGKGPILEQGPTSATNWVKEMVDYMVTGGKLDRGLAVTAAYQFLEAPENITENKLHSARILGWCAEMTHAYLVIVDDIIDYSTTRRGKLCWHRQPHVGINAVNDSSLMYQALMELLSTQFGKTPEYMEMVKLINETIYITSIGQYLDCNSSYNKKKNNLDGFTMELFNTIAIKKTSYYTMRFPLYLGLLLVKDGHLKPRKEWSEICYNLGILLQLQNDYIDSFGPESVTGKAGSDIQEGKLTWVAVTTLQLCNDQQREIFKGFYGSDDPNHVNKIKEVFKELKIPQLYEVHESKVYNDLVNKINALPTEGESKFFLNLLNKWYKRVL